MTELLHKNEVYDIVGAAMEVHRVLGCGFLEGIYQEALQIELTERSIPYLPQQELSVYFKSRRLKKTYIADFIAFGKIIVEIKALPRLTSLEEAQILNYLKAAGLEVGLMINFGSTSLTRKRYVLSNQGIVDGLSKAIK
jgi:GxxExxY protein